MTHYKLFTLFILITLCFACRQNDDDELVPICERDYALDFTTPVFIPTNVWLWLNTAAGNAVFEEGLVSDGSGRHFLNAEGSCEEVYDLSVSGALAAINSEGEVRNYIFAQTMAETPYGSLLDLYSSFTPLNDLRGPMISELATISGCPPIDSVHFPLPVIDTPGQIEPVTDSYSAPEQKLTLTIPRAWLEGTAVLLSVRLVEDGTWWGIRIPLVISPALEFDFSDFEPLRQVDWTVSGTSLEGVETDIMMVLNEGTPNALHLGRFQGEDIRVQTPMGVFPYLVKTKKEENGRLIVKQQYVPSESTVVNTDRTIDYTDLVITPSSISFSNDGGEIAFLSGFVEPATASEQRGGARTWLGPVQNGEQLITYPPLGEGFSAAYRMQLPYFSTAYDWGTFLIAKYPRLDGSYSNYIRNVAVANSARSWLDAAVWERLQVDL